MTFTELSWRSHSLRVKREPCSEADEHEPSTDAQPARSYRRLWHRTLSLEVLGIAREVELDTADADRSPRFV